MIKFTENQVAELKAKVEARDKDSTFFRRVQVVFWRSTGIPEAQAAKLSGFTRQAISRLCRAYRESGLDALKSHYVGSNYRRLTVEREREILEELDAFSKEGKYTRASDLCAAFEEKAGIKYGKNSFYGVLKRHKWRRIKPRGENPKKATEGEISTSKKLTLCWMPQ